MPAASYRWLPRESLLSDDEIVRLARLFVSNGVTKLRLTGGEPLLRPGLPGLVERLAVIPGVADLALTTNGTRLATAAADLRNAGLHRITVSLDTLEPDALRQLSRHGKLSTVLAGLDAVAVAGFSDTKLNTVVMRGVNDDQIEALVRFASARMIEPRFIEYMDVGGATEWQPELVVSGAEMAQRLAAAFGGAEPLEPGADRHAPARRWRLGDGTIVGLVTSTTAPFCGECDRSRLTADGTWFRCLYAARGTDLREPIRNGASDDGLRNIIRTGWEQRTDRGAEQRLRVEQRSTLVAPERLSRDPHLEMHVRGG